MATVYCLTGYPGSGKSEAAAAASRLGYRTISMGEVVRKHATSHIGEDAKEEEISRWADQKRDGDERIIARLTIEEVKPVTADLVVEGVRSPAELGLFRESFDNVHVIEIFAPEDVRRERIKQRGRKGEDAETLSQRDTTEKEWGLDEVIAQRDSRICNTGTLDELEARIEATLDTDYE